jgi:hypothetical protein
MPGTSTLALEGAMWISSAIDALSVALLRRTDDRLID